MILQYFCVMSRFSFPMQTYSGRINISTKTHNITPEHDSTFYVTAKKNSLSLSHTYTQTPLLFVICDSITLMWKASHYHHQFISFDCNITCSLLSNPSCFDHWVRHRFHLHAVQEYYCAMVLNGKQFVCRFDWCFATDAGAAVGLGMGIPLKFQPSMVADICSK